MPTNCLDAWYRHAKKAHWTKHADLKAVCKSADVVGRFTVINIGGNKYCLILEIFYESSLVLIRYVLTHEEYDENKWRENARKPTRQRTPPRKRAKPGGGPQ